MARIENYDDANRVLYEIAMHESFIAKKEAEMNAAISKIKEKYELETKDSIAKKELLIKELQEFCLINKNEFQKNRTKQLLFGIIGFRTTTPKVSQLNRKYSVKTTIELIKRIFNGKYIRTVEELNKELILQDYSSQQLTDDKLAAVGLKIDQEDKFVYEINWEAIR